MAVMGTRLMFLVGCRTIAGNLGGKALYCTIRPARGGALPPAGDYDVSPPVRDPVYGKVALLRPAEGSAAIPGGKFEKPLEKWDDWLASRSATFKFWRPGADRGPVFVLGGRPVLGRNSIVVSSGFADLMDGLQTVGGANVTVA